MEKSKKNQEIADLKEKFSNSTYFILPILQL